MIILGIETSCDETALSIIEASGTLEKPIFRVLANSVLSQLKVHEKHGGVFPMLAKREHARNLVPLFKQTLKDAALFQENDKHIKFTSPTEKAVRKKLEREPELAVNFLETIPLIRPPQIDRIAVTSGPGLEPALWVGINFAKALSFAWNIPIISVNHMEGHICSVLANNTGFSIPTPEYGVGTPIETSGFPILALLVSGGHTELVFSKEWGKYKVVGETRDDAVGEAYDKVGRMLAIPYPAGPEISRLAEEDRKLRRVGNTFNFPRPMIHSDDLDFSFSGLKTSVLYTLKKMRGITPDIKREIAREFEDAVVEVLVLKTSRAIESFSPKTLILGGGVSANIEIRRAIENLGQEHGIAVQIPPKELSTDNALMIAMAGYIKSLTRPQIEETNFDDIRADGNLRLA